MVELLLSERAPDSLVELEQYTLLQLVQHVLVCRLYAAHMRHESKEA